jgi:hypothetical protein
MLLNLVKKYPNELTSRYLSRYIYHPRLKTSQYLLPLGHSDGLTDLGLSDLGLKLFSPSFLYYY